jgi:hypothetical protein
MTKATATALAATLLTVLGSGLRAQQNDEERAKQKIREEQARALNSGNLRQIGIAFHDFHDNQKVWPRHAIYSPDGKTPLLSWRVTILPYLGEKALFDQFKLGEPWDSPHNKKLIAKMPQVYAPVLAGKADEGKTHYQVFTGPNTLFDGLKKLRITDIRDGTSNTLLVMEAKNTVIWTAPHDLTLPRGAGRLPPIAGQLKDGIAALFCDGSVHLLRPDPPADVLRAVITPSGGEVVDMDRLLR